MTILILIIAALMSGSSVYAQAGSWLIHDPDRPQPQQVTPGNVPGAPPSDAIVLFDGKNLDSWRAADGGAAKWKLGDGYFEVNPGSGDLFTRQAFGDCELHVEWASPNQITGDSQERGNSGVFLMGLFEVQEAVSWTD